MTRAITAFLTLTIGLSILAVPAPATAMTIRPIPHLPYEHVCPVPAPGHMSCLADVVVGSHPNDAAPYGPTTLHAAYNLPWQSPVAQTIAIVDAGGDSSIRSDLAAYDSRYQLPTASLTVVNQDGGSSLPASAGWEMEIALDVETVHAICTNCSILLVEANTATDSDLSTAENTAARLGATEISNSYGGPENSSLNTSAYNHPGIAITASTGDSGYGIESPASIPSVIAVGGTTLYTGTNGSYSYETAWNGAGSGCSAIYAKPAWQDVNTGFCTKRAVADVSADADPNSGVAVMNGGQWVQVGGTSLASPLIASVIALAGGMAGVQNPAAIPYRHQGSFHDITSGSNGSCGIPVCTANGGPWSGPTGIGSPSGVSGFQATVPTPSPTATVAPSPTAVPVTPSPVPTATTVPPTVAPTATPVPPTPSPTNTPVQPSPTATVAPTATPVPPTPVPTATNTPVPTATVVPPPPPAQPTPTATPVRFHFPWKHWCQYTRNHGRPCIPARVNGQITRIAWAWQHDAFLATDRATGQPIHIPASTVCGGAMGPALWVFQTKIQVFQGCAIGRTGNHLVFHRTGWHS